MSHFCPPKILNYLMPFQGTDIFDKHWVCVHKLSRNFLLNMCNKNNRFSITLANRKVSYSD